MSLMAHYDAAVAAGEIVDSPSQRDVVVVLESIEQAVLHVKRSWLFPWRKKQVSGLYMYGPVGVGKTYLMDLFYQNLPEPRKARFHFHHFMQQIDSELRRLQGTRDPLRQIARAFAASHRVLCLDEFLVHDVADAMILADLLQGLLVRGVVLIATANTRPDDLYLHGVRRERFLPAIALIKQDCQVLTVQAPRDYRLGRSSREEAYLTPLNKKADAALLRQFDTLEPNAVEGGVLSVQQRDIKSVKVGVHAVWFAFDALCTMPRSQLDYIELAERFDIVFLSHIPVIHPDDTVRAILFIHFVDVMYDQGVRLVVSAAALPAELYPQGAMCVPFKRTRSRLEEMQSVDYITRHRKLGHND